MKAFVVGGAGVVGSSTASFLISRSVVDEVVLQDLNKDMAESHAMDLAQSAFSNSKTKVWAGDWEDARDAGIVIVGAGLSPNKMSFDPCKDIAAMRPLIDSICEGLNRYCPNAVVLSLTNPLDVFNYVLYSNAKLPSKQFLALSANDSMRFQWALGHYFNMDSADIDAYVIGEHGGNKIPLFSTVSLNGKRKMITQDEQVEIVEWMDAWWKRFLSVSGNRTAGWTTGMYAALTIEHIVGKQTGPICASAIMEDGLSIGYPVYLDKSGFVKPEKLELSEKEENEFEIVKNSCREKIQTVLDYMQTH